MNNPSEVYDLLLDHAAASDEVAREFILGLTWTLCHGSAGTGLAMSPAAQTGLETRRLPWSGTLAGRKLSELASWLRSWQPFEAAVGMAAVNAALNTTLPENAVPLSAGNLAVFEHFLPHLVGKKVAVIGRYPGLDIYQESLDMVVLERQPGKGDLPDPAAEYLLPDMDWVFLTASSLTNKTFPRLAELSRDANLVLMGPTTPWLEEFRQYGVDFLAGVAVQDGALLRSTVAEGGGMCLFDKSVCYHVADLGTEEMAQLKAEIAVVFKKRQYLKDEMESWYAGSPRGAFPRRAELEQIDAHLSALDSRYKRLWDARFGAKAQQTEQRQLDAA